MQIHKYTYLIKNVVLSLDTSYAVPNDNIIYLNGIYEFLTRRFPIYQLGLQMDSSTIKKVYNNSNKAKVKIEVYEKVTDGDGNVTSTNLFMQKSFSIIPARAQSEYITSQDNVTQKNISDINDQQAFEMYLVDMTIVDYFNKEISNIWNIASKPVVLQMLFNMRGIPANTVIATPPQDINVVQTIILPSGKLKDNINHLNKVYGLYKANALIFHDFKYLYCLNRIEPNITLSSNTDYGNVTFSLFNSTNEAFKVTGVTDDMKTKTHVVNIQGPPVINDISNMKTASMYSTLTTVDSSGNVSKSTEDSNSSKMLYAYKYNDFTADQMYNETLRTDMTTQLTIADSAIGIFKPYKKYNYSCGTQYTTLGLNNLEFRLSRMAFAIQRNGNEFKHTIDLNIYKI